MICDTQNVGQSFLQHLTIHLLKKVLRKHYVKLQTLLLVILIFRTIANSYIYT